MKQSGKTCLFLWELLTGASKIYIMFQSSDLALLEVATFQSTLNKPTHTHDKTKNLLHESYIFLNCLLAQMLSHVWLFVVPRTVTHQDPLSMGFSHQEYWSGLPFPSPRDLPNPGIELTSLMSPALAGRLFTTSATWEAQFLLLY